MKSKEIEDVLIKPVSIGSLELKNRIVMLPMETNYANEDGSVSDQLKSYYRRRANDVGLILIQITCIEPEKGKGYVNQLCVHDDRLIPGLKELVDTIHQKGAKVIIQLHHAGANALGTDIVSASAIPLMPGRTVPKALTIPEIKEIEKKYATAAARAKKAGFDGVEIVCSGNYLLWNFLSPTWNQRSDEYGGTLEGRAKFYLDVIKSVKAKVGDAYPVTTRLALTEYGTDNGFSISDAKQVLKWAIQAGLEGLTVTAIGADSIAPPYPGVLVPLAKAMKHEFDIPVTVAAGMNLALGASTIEKGDADLVGIGRRLLGDPEYVSKILAGREDDVRPCIACKRCIEISLLANQPLQCAINPCCGQEDDEHLKPTATPKNIWVIGGGPAGMNAAITAAKRNHSITIFDKGDTLGGQLIAATRPPKKERLEELTTYLKRQVKKRGINVNLRSEVDQGMISREAPDAVIFATGIKDFIPPIPGVESAHTATATEVLTNKAVVGLNIAVIGGDLTGCEVAEFLADKGMTVTIIEILDQLMPERSPVVRMGLLQRLTMKGVNTITGVVSETYKDNTLSVKTKDNEKYIVPADTIVYAAGGKPDNAVYNEVRKHHPEVYAIGDCQKPRDIQSAMAEGYQIGLKV